MAIVTSDQGETYLRLLAEVKLRHHSSSWEKDSRAEDLWSAATTLTAIGAVPVDVAQQIVADFEAAAALRPGSLASLSHVADRPFPAPAPVQAGSGERSFELTVVPVGRSLLLPPRSGGWAGEIWVISAARTASSMVLNVAARWVPQGGRTAAPCPSHPPPQDVEAVDENGKKYDLREPGWWRRRTRASPGWWDGFLVVSPVPPNGSPWLDIGPGAGGTYMRIDLAARPKATQVAIGPAELTQAERLLDRAAEALLLAYRSASLADVANRVAQVMRTLAGAGALTPGEPAWRRTAALGRRLGLDLGLRDAGHDGVPLPWASIATARDAADGQEFVVPVAAVLPELGGARFAFTGLRSARHSMMLSFLAVGFQPGGAGWLISDDSYAGLAPDPSFAIHVRDSAGRWHIVESMSSWASGGAAQVQAVLIPPLHPSATSAEVIVTGPASRVSAGVPLNWQAAP